MTNKMADPIREDEIGSFASRLKLLIGNESARKFALRVGVSETMIRKYLKGGVPGLDIAVRIAEEANVNLEWLATGIGEMDALSADAPNAEVDNDFSELDYEQPGLEYLDEFAFVNCYKVNVGDISSKWDRQPICQKFAFNRKSLELRGLDPKDLKIFFVKSYLEGSIISSGDSVMLNTNDKVLSDGVFAIELNNAVLIRWVKLKIDGSVEVYADIEAEPDDVVSSEQTNKINIIGRVVWLGKDFK